MSQLPAVPEKARREIASLLQEGTDLSVTAPEAATFESQSGGVLEMVEGMGEKFEDKKDEIEKEEMKKKFAFESVAQDLLNSIKDATAEREEKVARVHSLTSEKGAA